MDVGYGQLAWKLRSDPRVVCLERTNARYLTHEQVPDALDAMIRLGANYRALYSPLLAGVTGSVGKTTTKEFCYAVFSAFGKTLRTQGNQNNEIGMPNTLFRLDKSVEYAVVEMGMQGLGEIRKLTLAAKPAGAVITCIGRSHLEQRGTRGKYPQGKAGDLRGAAAGRAAGGERRRRLSARRGRPAGP